MYCNICNKYRKCKKTWISYSFEKTLSLSVVYSKWGHELKKVLKEEDSIEILKNIGLINTIEEYQKIYDRTWSKHEWRI